LLFAVVAMGILMTTHRRHRCKRRHRSYRTLAKCIWRRAQWVKGEGPYAVLYHLGGLTVSLHEREVGAEAMARILERQYGQGRPRLARLVDPKETQGI